MKRIFLSILAAFGLSIGVMAMTPATFPGGKDAEQAYFSTNMKYPQTAKDNGIEGIVTVMFTVKADGTVGNIKIKRMVDPDLEAEAIRLVKQMPKWTPAEDNGQSVESVAEVNVNFSLD